MTKTELERAVADAAGVEKRTAAAVLDTLQDVVTTNVRKGQAVTIRPGFIKVSRKDVKARKAPARARTRSRASRPCSRRGPASKTAKVTALKKLKDGVGTKSRSTGPDALGDPSRVAEPCEPDLDQNPTSIGRVWSPGPGGAIWA